MVALKNGAKASSVLDLEKSYTEMFLHILLLHKIMIYSVSK